MFQGFSKISHGAADPARLGALRDAIAKAGLDGFILPRGDAHQGEYVPPGEERLAFVTGFSGSAGCAAVLAKAAALFVDGRYTVQAASETDPIWSQIKLEPGALGDWLARNAPSGGRIGFDPWLHGRDEIAALRARLSVCGVTLEETARNLVDTIWPDQPPPPAAAIRVHPDDLSGEPADEKRARIGASLREAGADAAFLSLPDSIAWLFNIRGGDIPRNPVPLVFALIRTDGTATLFADDSQMDSALRLHLGPDVERVDRAKMLAFLSCLEGQSILLDARTCPILIATELERAGAVTHWGQDPCIMPKAIKNAREQSGARAAHLRDGVAMARFLAWLDSEAPKGTLTEIDIAKRLEEERRATQALLDISFDTISGSGPNGAIVHYRVMHETNRTLAPGELMLIDSGGQYADGTTDITRTISVGPPPQGAAHAFTLVLKGMIGLSLQRFPEGTTGRDLDVVARAALWRAGLDYDHGTGHGVGAYLCVHEGPQSISRRGMVPLLPGMICSNEPGYYREGAFGIRIENLILVTPPAIPEGGERAMLGFETLTLCPIDRRLIVAEALTAEERAWLNAYHARVLAEIGPALSEDVPVYSWLKEACAPI